MMKKTLLLTTGLLSAALLSLSAQADDKATKTKKKAKTKEVASSLELFPEDLYNAKGEKVSRDELKDKVVGIYFSAHWCPPCKTFTPKLVKFRDENKDDFEIVFVSSDRDETAQMGYMKEAKMEWLAVKFGTQGIADLKKRYAVRGIPSLIIIGPDGKTISTNGRGEVTSTPKKALAAWQKKAGIKEASSKDSSKK